MTGLLSPLSQRLIAIGLLLLAMLLFVSLLVVPLATAIGDSLARLADDRAMLGAMEAERAAPPAAMGDPIPPHALVMARSRDEAVATLASTISAAAAATGVKDPLISPPPGGTNGPAIAVDLSASGSETALVAMLAQIEAPSSPIRCQSWAITAPETSGAPTRLQAHIVAVWDKGA